MIKPVFALFMLLLLSSVTALRKNRHMGSQFNNIKSDFDQALGEIQRVFRWYSPSREYHFYSLDPNGDLATQAGYVYEGVEFCTLTQPATYSSTLFQIVIYGSYVYTIYVAETQQPNAIQAGNIGYVYSFETYLLIRDLSGDPKIQQTVPLYRWYRPSNGDHFYFVDPSVESHLALGYQSEGIQAHVIPCKQEVINIKPSDFRAINKSEVGAGDLKLNDGFDSSDIAFYTLHSQVNGSERFRKVQILGGIFYTTAQGLNFLSDDGDIGFLFIYSTIVTLRDNSGNFLENLATVPLHEWRPNDLNDNSIYSTNRDIENQIPTGYHYTGVIAFVLPRTFMNKLATYTS